MSDSLRTESSLGPDARAKFDEAKRAVRAYDLQRTATVLRVVVRGRLRHRLRGCDHPRWVLGGLSWPFQTRTCARCERMEDVSYE